MAPVAHLSHLAFEAVLANVADIVLVVGADDQISYINHVLPGYDRGTVIGQPATAYVPPEQRQLMLDRLRQVRATAETVEYEVETFTADGGRAWWSSRMTLLRYDTDEPLVLIIARDVSAMRLAEEGRLIAAAELKKVMNLLPICAWCKRVRDDEGYWEDVTTYIHNSTGVEMTHGICPACFATLNAER